MQLDPVLVLPDTDVPRGLLSRRSLLALLGAGGAVAAGSALGVLLTPHASAAQRGAAPSTLEEAELRWARSLAEGPLGALVAARSPYLFVLARTGDAGLVDGAERLAQLVLTVDGPLVAAGDREAVTRQLVESLRASGLVERDVRAAALVARLGGAR